jgi:lysozyme family protein
VSAFGPAIDVVLRHEGGWVCDPSDLGGETNFGWSMSTIHALGLKPRDLGIDQDEFTPGCLKGMTAEKAAALYFTEFWTRYGYDRIVPQAPATKVFDAAVNCGPARAARFAQLAINALGGSVTVDESLGPRTIAAINALEAQRFVNGYASQMNTYYDAIVQARPANAKFAGNWARRAAWGVS